MSLYLQHLAFVRPQLQPFVNVTERELGAHVTVSRASGISKTVTATFPVQSRSRKVVDAVDTMTWAPGGGWRYHPKYVEQFTDINKLVDSFRTAAAAGSGWNCVPSWSCSKAVYKPVWHIPLLSVQWITPDDGQRNCTKHVEFHSKINLRNWCI
jgi:hypothetical protein